MENTATPTTTIGDAKASLALADSSPATPEPQTPAAETPAPAAITQAADEPSTQVDPASTEPPKGEPPKWRWQDILQNARETEYTRGRQEIEQQYQWAKDIADAERDGLLTWRAAMNGDPRAIAHIKANPEAVAWLRGLVAEQAPPAADPEPEPDLQTADGQLVYSATRLKEWREWSNRQLTSNLKQEFQKELQPLQKVAQSVQQQESRSAYTQSVAGAVARMKAADPAFEKHTKDVLEQIQKDPRLSKLALDDGDPDTAIELAWARVYRDKVLPTEKKAAEQQVLANLQQRAVAGTTNPGTATTTTPPNTLGNARAALEHAHATLGG